MEWTPEQIKQLRRHLGMTQEEFGVHLGYGEAGSQVRASELERGVQRASGPLVRLLDLLAEKHDFEPEK